MPSRRRALTPASRGQRAVAGSIDGALLLGLALGSMAVSRRRKHTEPAATDVEVASEATAEGRHPNGSLAAAEPTEEGVHSNGSPAPAEPASESSDAEQSQFPGSHHGRALVIGAGGFAIEALEGCGRSPDSCSSACASGTRRAGRGSGSARRRRERSRSVALSWSGNRPSAGRPAARKGPSARGSRRGANGSRSSTRALTPPRAKKHLRPSCSRTSPPLSGSWCFARSGRRLCCGSSTAVSRLSGPKPSPCRSAPRASPSAPASNSVSAYRRGKCAPSGSGSAPSARWAFAGASACCDGRDTPSSRRDRQRGTRDARSG